MSSPSKICLLRKKGGKRESRDREREANSVCRDYEDDRKKGERIKDIIEDLKKIDKLFEEYTQLPSNAPQSSHSSPPSAYNE